MHKLRLIFTGLAGYIHILLFPVLISLIVSLVTYLTMPDTLGIIASLFLCICGLITGLVMALRVLKKRGISAFVPQEDKEEDPLETETTEKS